MERKESEEEVFGFNKGDSQLEALHTPKHSNRVGLTTPLNPDAKPQARYSKTRVFVFVAVVIVALAAISVSVAYILRKSASQGPQPPQLVVSYTLLTPDGFPRQVMTGNNVLPGPTIDAYLGETLEVLVTNHLPVPTTIHWHGMLLNKTTYMDGAAFTSQCPIPPGKSLLYRFPITQTGTFWWHSHFHGQYGNGLYGALILHPSRQPAPWEDRILMLGDWYHRSIEDLAVEFLSITSTGNEPVPDAGLINGKGMFNCSLYAHQQCEQHTYKDLYTTVLVVNRTYRFRLIASSAISSYNFAIDDHNLIVIETDGIETEPLVVPSVYINTAERYSVLVTPTKVGSFWIRAFMDQDMYPLVNPVLDNEIRGIIRVVASDEAIPTDEEPTSVSSIDIQEITFDQYDLFMKEVMSSPEPTFNFTFDVDFVDNAYGVNLPTVNGYSQENPKVPVLHSILNNPGYEFQLENNVVFLPPNEVVQVIIINRDDGAHPFHLHGHVFQVVSHGILPYNDTASFTTENPLRRDVINIPAFGFAVIRFVTDNPGVWAMHCHIDWHFMAGLGVTFIEDVDTVSKMKLPQDHLDICKA